MPVRVSDIITNVDAQWNAGKSKQKVSANQNNFDTKMFLTS